MEFKLTKRTNYKAWSKLCRTKKIFISHIVQSAKLTLVFRNTGKTGIVRKKTLKLYVFFFQKS